MPTITSLPEYLIYEHQLRQRSAEARAAVDALIKRLWHDTEPTDAEIDAAELAAQHADDRYKGAYNRAILNFGDEAVTIALNAIAETTHRREIASLREFDETVRFGTSDDA